MYGVRAVLAGMMVVLTACSLTVLDGFSSGSDSPVSEGTDAAPDGARGDGGPDGAGEAAGTWCGTNAPAADFCVDFDGRGVDLFDRQVTQNGTLGVDRLFARSMPSSLWVTAGSASRRAEVFLEKDGAAEAKRASVSFDLRVEGTHEIAAVEVAHLKFNRGSNHYTVGFGIMPGAQGAYAYEYSPSPSIYEDRVLSHSPIPLDTWVHVDLAADLAAKTVTLARDDESGAVTRSLTAATSGAAELEVGIVFANAGDSGWKVRIDNIVFDSN